MFYDGWIRFVAETYLFLAVCVCLNCNYLIWNTFGDAFNSLWTIFFGAVLLAYPFFAAIYYNKNYLLIE